MQTRGESRSQLLRPTAGTKYVFVTAGVRNHVLSGWRRARSSPGSHARTSIKFHDLENLEKAAADNPRTGQPTDSNASMLLRHLKVYRFTVRLAAPERQACVPHCTHSFAQLVLNQASD